MCSSPRTYSGLRMPIRRSVHTRITHQMAIAEHQLASDIKCIWKQGGYRFVIVFLSI